MEKVIMLTDRRPALMVQHALAAIRVPSAMWQWQKGYQRLNPTSLAHTLTHGLLIVMVAVCR